MALQDSLTDINIKQARVEERLTVMDEKLDKLIYAIDGNGKPGLLIRVDRVEQKERMARWAIAVVVGAILVQVVERLL
jgi:hypothetical protein